MSEPVEIRGVAYPARMAVYRMVRSWGEPRRRALWAALLVKRVEMREVPKP